MRVVLRADGTAAGWARSHQRPAASVLSSRKSSRYACGGCPRSRSSRAFAISARKRGRSSRGCSADSASSASGSASSRSRQRSSACCRAASISWPCAQSVEPPADGLGVDVAHQLADVLQLPLAPAPGRDRARVPNRVAQPLGQRDFGGELGEPLRFEQTSASPMSCSACISALRRLFDGGRRSASASPAAAVAAPAVARGGRCSRSSGRVIVLAEIGGEGRGCGASRREPFAMIAEHQPAGPAPRREALARKPLDARRPPTRIRTAPARGGVAVRGIARRRDASPLPTAEIERLAETVLAAAKAGGATAAETEVSQGGRAERHRAPRRGRDHRLQPRQGHRRHGLHRAAPRAREHRRLLARGAAGRGRQGAGHRALHGRRPGRGARGSGPARARDSRISTSTIRGRSRSRTPSRSACETEAAALAVDRRLTNTEGATVAWNESEFVYANSLGFLGGYPQHAPPHRLRGDRRSRRRRRDAARLLVHGRARRGGPAGRRRRRAHRRRAHRAPARRAQARHASSARCCSRRPRPPTSSARSSARSRAARSTASRRSCSIRSASRCSRRSCRSARSRTSRAPAAARRSTTRAWRPRRATSCSDGVVRGYFLGSYSARKLGMASTGNAGGSHNLVLAHGDDDLRRAAAAHGPRALRHRAARARRQPGHRRLLARRRGLLGRGRRDRLPGRGDHDRRQPARTCTATSSRSAATSTGAARATRDPS